MAELTPRLMATLDSSQQYLALFNDLKGLSGLENMVVFKEFMTSDLANITDFVMGPVALVTALDMPGFSISMVPLRPEYEAALLSPLGNAAWPSPYPTYSQTTITPPIIAATPDFTPSPNAQVRTIVETVIDTCLRSEDKLNELDAQVGDGDTGSTFAGAARVVESRLDLLPMANGSRSRSDRANF